MTVAGPRIPIFTASTRKWAKTASICADTNAARTGSMPVTRRVFWAVSAMITATS
jgi:hypothetical protein